MGGVGHAHTELPGGAVQRAALPALCALRLARRLAQPAARRRAAPEPGTASSPAHELAFPCGHERRMCWSGSLVIPETFLYLIRTQVLSWSEGRVLVYCEGQVPVPGCRCWSRLRTLKGSLCRLRGWSCCAQSWRRSCCGAQSAASSTGAPSWRCRRGVVLLPGLHYSWPMRCGFAGCGLVFLACILVFDLLFEVVNTVPALGLIRACGHSQ